jgi:excisionase family DNA binding protein
LSQGLLTIEEAANYLRVSKTSLRRWTREGRLACERIGPRAERRFRVEVLDRFLASSRPAASAPAPTDSARAAGPLAALDAAAAQGLPRHVSLHHADRDELWRLFRPYLVHHLRLGAPVLYIHDEAAGEDVLARLRADGVDADALEAKGLLRLLVPSRAYLRTGSFSPDRMIDFMESTILDFRAMGHTIVLISGEMTWYLTGAPGVEGMIAYEGKLNELLRRHPGVTIVCHYDVERLSGRITLGALCTHPHVQLPDRLASGLYPA